MLQMISYIFRRFLAFIIDIYIWSFLPIPFFFCFLLFPLMYYAFPLLYDVFQKNYLEALAAFVNLVTMGAYGIVVEIVKFIIQLFIHHMFSWAALWNELLQLIQDKVADYFVPLVNLIIFLFFIVIGKSWSESSKNQASIGKRIVGLKVTHHSTGGRVSFPISLIRNFVLVYGGFIFAPLIFITDRKQTLPDIITGAVVIDTDPIKSPVLAGLLSFFFFGGGGQIYNGQFAKGITIILLTSLLSVVGIGFFIEIIACIDAVVMANKIKKGKKIGKWQFFWSHDIE